MIYISLSVAGVIVLIASVILTVVGRLCCKSSVLKEVYRPTAPNLYRLPPVEIGPRDNSGFLRKIDGV